MATLTASSLSPDLSFNWVFLIELITCGVVALFFLFYFNRVFAVLVSFALRAWTWHKYRVYIDIQSLQISILGGRIFFKGVKYHGNNETILIHEGYITWKYWLAKVQELDLAHQNDQSNHTQGLSSAQSSAQSEQKENEHRHEEDDVSNVERGGGRKTQSLPCRLSVRVRGLEWFIYNRSPAYDDILAALTGDRSEKSDTASSEEVKEKNEPHRLKHLRKRRNNRDAENVPESGVDNQSNPDTVQDVKSSITSSNEHEDIKSRTTFATQNTSNYDSSIAREIAEENEKNIVLQFLPVQVEISKAAIVMGNENTKSVLIVKVEKGQGKIGATPCEPPDLYRQIIDFDLEHPVVQMKPNDDYKEEQTTAGARLKTGKRQTLNTLAHTHKRSFLHRYRRKVVHQLARLSPSFQRSMESVISDNIDTEAIAAKASYKWQGLSRYLDDFERDDKARWSTIEYAVVTTLVDCSAARISYYWDIPGKVEGDKSSRPRTSWSDVASNGGPAFGIDIYLRNSVVNYGPWADRQRAEIQKVFFPGLCKDALPGKQPVPGDTRAPQKFQVYVQLEQEVTLRVPMREESKNWKWKKNSDTIGQNSGKQNRSHRIGRKKKIDKGPSGPEVRPFGWIDVKVAADSTVTYTMDMIAQATGFSNNLHLDIPNVEITTSVNHGILWRSADVRLMCDLSNPLKWNALHTWKFDIVSNGLELFILREHIFLIQDLVEDFTTGPPPDYLTFTPFKYLLDLTFGDFRLYLNTNDFNIINNPSDFDDNTYLIIFGTHLLAEVCIPNENFRPYRNDITFAVSANTGGLNLHVPPWNTQATLLTQTELAHLKDLQLSGKYQLCSTTSPANTDTLLLDIHAKDLEAELYGFLIRYFLVLKENYFGEHIHFKTLDEHQKSLHTEEGLVEDPAMSQPIKKSNDLDVILTISSQNNCVVIPSNLYSAKNNVRIDFSTLSLDLRFTNYYMDMLLNICPLSFSRGHDQSGQATPLSGSSSSQLFIDGIDVFGHRLFGLPHTEPTYVCNWDFTVGAVKGETSMEFLSHLFGGIRALTFSIDDDENALPGTTTTQIYDVTFLRASVQHIRVWLHVDEAVLLLSTAELDVTFDDWAGDHYSKKLHVSLPKLILACVDESSESRHRTRTNQAVNTHAFLQTSLKVDMVERSTDFDETSRLQQLHLRREDCRTDRTPFLLHTKVLADMPYDVPAHLDIPAMPFPPMPSPLKRNFNSKTEDSYSSPTSSLRSRRQGRRSSLRRSSFLSTSSSSTSRHGVDQKFNASVHEAQRNSKHHRGLSPPLQPRPSLRGRSMSTGHGSSTHSINRGLPPTSVVFSSPYLPSHFPLDSVEPDLTDVPEVVLVDARNSLITPGQISIDEIDDQKFDCRSTYTSIIVQLNDGIRAYCNPKAISTLFGLITAMQAVYPEDILDVLQTDSVKEIFEDRKKSIRSGTNTDLKIVVPVTHIRFLSMGQNPTNNSDNEIDQYDLILDGLDVTLRNTLKPRSGNDGLLARRQVTTLHTKLTSAKLSATERLGTAHRAQAAVNLSFEDTIFWLMQDDETLTVNLKLRAVQVATQSQKVEYLASLVSRTTSLGNGIANDAKQLISSQQNRLRLFVFLLSSKGSAAADPMFLTRPSYVLRAVDNHLRTMDSWKVVSRLRYMFRSLDRETRHNITMRVMGNSEACPFDVKEQVLRGLDEWRSWDLNNLHGCVVAKKVFGLEPEEAELAIAEKEKLVRIAVAIADVGLVLDPGPKQNDIALTTIGLNTEISPSHDSLSLRVDNDGEDVDTVSPTLTTIHIYCSDSSMSLNWEMLAFAESVIKLYEKHRHMSEKTSPSADTISLQEVRASRRRQIHLILDVEKGSLLVESVNLKLISVSEGFKSALLIDEKSTTGRKLISLVSSCEAATSKIRGRSVDLSLCQIRYPSICASLETHFAENIEHNTWKVSANSQEITFAVIQHGLVLLEIVDSIILDEVAQLLALGRLVSKGSTEERISASRSRKEESEAVTTVNIALFLETYKISFSIVESLSYHVSGIVARAAVAARLGAEIIFDFDIKENTHDVRTTSHDKSKSVALVQMPSTNGRVRCYEKPNERVVSLLTTVEQIEIDAAAIYNLIDAFSRPEISNLLEEAKDSMGVVQKHVNELTSDQHQKKDESSDSSMETSTTGSTLVYKAHVALEGLGIFAETTKKEGDIARLSFNTGSIQVDVANHSTPGGPTLPFPDVRVALGEVVFDLAEASPFGFGTDSCGNFRFTASLIAGTKTTSDGQEMRFYHLRSDGLEINVFSETAPTIIDVLGHMQDKIKGLDLTREKQYLQKLRKPVPKIKVNDREDEISLADDVSLALFTSIWSLELLSIHVSWITSINASASSREREDLVLSFQRINLSTRKENSARLTIENMQLQMVPVSADRQLRSPNSALLPEVIFNVAHVSSADSRRFAFQAAGKSLDLQLTSQFLIPLISIKDSIANATDKVRKARASWSSSPDNLDKLELPKTEVKKKPLFGKKRIGSLLVDADFAGAVVHLSKKKVDTRKTGHVSSPSQNGRYGQFVQEDTASSTTLRAPGLAWKIEFKDNGVDESTLDGEIKVSASANILYPTVVPLILEISESVKDVVSSGDNQAVKMPPVAKDQGVKNTEPAEANILAADPSAVLGKTKLNLGLRICKQEFSLSCQPIARVAAVAQFDDIYVTINTVKSKDYGHFFSISMSGRHMQASVQHVYSRESTGSFEVDSVVLSLMNSKHVSGTAGLSAILNVSPAKVLVNAKQLQDFLLFREIWLPPELRSGMDVPAPQSNSAQAPTILVQRYQQVAATGAFPWNATIHVAELDVQLDLGQAIGKSSFMISKFWILSKKDSDWEQNLCLGFTKMGVDCVGRMSGFLHVEDFRVRSSIQWPDRELAINQTPLVQASIAMRQFRAKAAFDYQPFLVADITSFDFLMYNVRDGTKRGDRLVAILDGDAVQIFCTTTTASQALAVYQAFQRLIQEKRANYDTSLREIERFMKRKSVAVPGTLVSHVDVSKTGELDIDRSPISLHTDVVVTLKAVNMGVFPSTFYDQQIFKLEALDAEARFAVTVDSNDKIHSLLGLTLGQLRVGLASVRRASFSQISADVSVDEVVEAATGSRGGTILKVPKVEAKMECWQQLGSNKIDYVFKSAFSGKVEVGWNYSRVSYIRGMYGNHTRSLAQRLGKPLPESAVKITGVPESRPVPSSSHSDESSIDDEATPNLKDATSDKPQKITAQVNVPQSKYVYNALVPPIIETPQLRDMGEATPPLEWIGLHRERLPTLTHQIVIVALCEVASEVEQAYGKILGDG